MTPPETLSLSLAAQVMKALGDESRLRIVHLLFEKTEMCVSDLELILDFTQTKTSRHLTYLRNAKLAEGRKVDQRTFYRICPDLMPLLEGLMPYLANDETLQKDLDTYRILYATQELAISRIHQQRWESPSGGQAEEQQEKQKP
ncbi:MAG: ArsR/SmtB family transcription factor [Bernardetiaceae bacterium]